MVSLTCWMCRHPNIYECKDNIAINTIMSGNNVLECPICYESKTFSHLFFTNCKHYACYNCINNMILKEMHNVRSNIYILIQLDNLIN